MAKLPPQPVGVPPGSSYWNDWYEKLRQFVDTATTSVAWSIITGKPTTLAGYGITDAQTKLNNSAGLAAALSDETGTGLCVFNTNPNLINPVLGVATATSLQTTGNIGAGGIAAVRIHAIQAGNCQVRADNGTSALELQSNANDGYINMSGTGTLFLRMGAGATTRATLSNTGNFSVSGTVTVGSTTLLTSSVALTNGAAAAAGTLTNAPTAGNPTKWIPINDNGTTRYIPAW